MITLRSSPCAPGSTLPPQSQCEVRSATSPALRRCGSHIKQLIPSLWCRLPHPTISASAQSNHEFPVNANPLSHWSDADSKDADGHEQQRPWWRKRPALPGLVGAMAALALLASPPEAAAVLNSPNAQIARTADAALRRSIPASNPEVKEIQKSLEDIAYLLRIPQRKPFGTMANDLQSALRRFESRDRLLEGVPADKGQEAAETLDTLYSSLKRLELAIKSQQGDYIGLRVGEALKVTAELELLQAPGLPYALPKDYQTLPRLIGRSVVELEVERDGALAFVDNVNGGLSSTATIQITLDGYSAPISSGRFLDNILSGRYNDRRIEASRSAVVAPSPSASQVPPVPLEILPLGEFDPVYRLPLDVQGGELPVLPLSINGAVSFTHVPGSDSYLDGDAFFMYKFDKQSAGLAGLAFDEGSFAVFGYVTRGVDVMDSLKSGDRIIRATVVSGADKLIKPSSNA